MMSHPGEAGEGATAKSPHAHGGHAPLDEMSAEELRREIQTLRNREREIAELLNAKSPEKIVHDLRNLLNEVQLLRILAEQSNA